MAEVDQRSIGHVFGRLSIQVATVWAVALIATSVLAKAGGDPVYGLYVLLGGAITCTALVEMARRRLVSAEP